MFKSLLSNTLVQKMRYPTGFALLLLTAATWTGCSQDTGDSRTNDIFQEDRGDSARGNSRRHPADQDEKLWTITMNGCTGHLISPDYMMTANHCKAATGAKYKSGYSIVRGQSNDITVTQVVESGADLDYSILKITWSGGYPKEQKFPPLIATKASDVRFGRETDSGDELFTVGFPQDKFGSWGATYAEGRAKIAQGGRLYYDIGIINGNSGGGVWRKSDKMLVSLTNGGAHAFGQSGWDSAGISSSANWNFGPPIWTVYERSTILKDIFPDGKNRFADAAGDQLSKDINVLIGSSENSAADTFTIFFSVPSTNAVLYFCSTVNADNCDQNASGYTATSAVKTSGGRTYFKANSATALNDGMHLSIIALDSNKKKSSAKTVKISAK